MASPEQSLYDLIILGASGFTGKHVVREALRFLKSDPSLQTLALAGRSPEKLSQTLRWAAHPNPPPPIPILAADTADDSSLRRLCGRARVVLNCVGPYRLHGEAVVAACAEAGCDYLDICGEPEFMERMEAEYGRRAAETGALVVSACGFDSIPAELGMMFNSRQWVGAAAPHKVEAYVSLESERRIVGNFGTYHSAVLGIANAEKLQELRRTRPKPVKPVIPGSHSSKGTLIKHQNKIDHWAVKLPSADSSIVRRTLSTLAQNPKGLPGHEESDDHARAREAFWSTVKPAHFGVKICSKSLLGILKYIVVGFFMVVFGRVEFGRWLLLTFPSFFSLGSFGKNGPSEEEVKSASFKMWFVGHGYSDSSLVSSKGHGDTKPDTEIITRVMGPEIGYATTPIILIQCALVLLSQRNDLPKGGVLTAGIVFGATNLQKRLQENGISFDVISKTALSSSSV